MLVQAGEGRRFLSLRNQGLKLSLFPLHRTFITETQTTSSPPCTPTPHPPISNLPSIRFSLPHLGECQTDQRVSLCLLRDVPHISQGSGQLPSLTTFLSSPCDSIWPVGWSVCRCLPVAQHSCSTLYQISQAAVEMHTHTEPVSISGHCRLRVKSKNILHVWNQHMQESLPVLKEVELPAVSPSSRKWWFCLFRKIGAEKKMGSYRRNW